MVLRHLSSVQTKMKTSELSSAISESIGGTGSSGPAIRRLRSLSVSDIHLGHPKTSTYFILDNLDRKFFNGEWWKDIDVLYIVGDLFHQALHYHSLEAVQIQRWMKKILRIAKEHNVVVRLLEGTPSHDWRQNRWMVEANDGIDADFKYVDTLSVEYIEALGIHVLYVPDEWKPDPDDVWKDVVRVMADAQIDQVDYTLFHATFDHQLPDIKSIPKHTASRYQQITRHYVFSGHIHVSSRNKNILCNGSFDRISHGEEGAKGYWDVTVTPHGDKVVFVENEHAKVYKTIDCTDLTLDETFDRLTSVADLPEGSHVRIKARKSDPIMSGMDTVARKYPHVYWTTKATEALEVQENLMVDKRIEINQTQFTEHNLGPLLMERVRARTTDPVLLARCETLLAENL
jgi:hypothetical protein